MIIIGNANSRKKRKMLIFEFRRYETNLHLRRDTIIGW